MTDDPIDQLHGNQTIKMTERPSPPSDSSSQTLSAGMLLDGRYLVIRELGHGGFSCVYLASDEKVMSKRVVIKVLKDGQVQDEWTVQKFKQEIEALSRIDHPSIVGVFDFGKLPSGSPYTVMQYVDGVTLRSCINPEGMQLDRVARLIKLLGSALAAAHDKGILHRDLKPENIMLQKLSAGEEQPTIIDFGIAKVKNSLIAPSTVEPRTVGTYVYMAPEQLRGGKASVASDVYSMGVIAYEMVTGRRPFNPQTVTQLAEMQREGIKVKPKDLRPALSQGAQTVILRALSFESAERFQNVREFANALEQALRDEEEILSEDVKKTLRRPEPLPRARRVKVMVVSAIAILLAGILGVVIWNNIHRIPSADVKGSMNKLLVGSVAVLPFSIGRTNVDLEFIRDGITDGLIDELSQLPSMKKVIARTSVFRFRGQEVDPQTVGRELDVEAVLVGEITSQGDDFVIRAELVATDDHRHLWSGQYKLRITEILVTQKEISRNIALSLQRRLTGGEGVQGNYPQNNEAYLLYLKGRFYWNQRTPDAIRMSVQYFNQAIAKDPNYAMAYAGLADSYSLMNDLPPNDTMPKAKAAALKALSIDNTLAEGHTSLALVMLRYEFDWSGAEREFKLAIALNPNYATAHRWYGHYLLANERSGEALQEIKRGQELDPLAATHNLSVGILFLYTRQYDKAIEHYHKMLQTEPNDAAHSYLRIAYQEKRMFDEAFMEAQKEFAPRFTSEQLEEVKRAYAVSGYKGLLVKELVLEKGRSTREYTSAVRLARICAVLGRNDEAFEWLNKAYEAREDGLIWLKVDPRYDNLRSDPRFPELVRRVVDTNELARPNQ